MPFCNTFRSWQAVISDWPAATSRTISITLLSSMTRTYERIGTNGRPSHLRSWNNVLMFRRNGMSLHQERSNISPACSIWLDTGNKYLCEVCRRPGDSAELTISQYKSMEAWDTIDGTFNIMMTARSTVHFSIPKSKHGKNRWIDPSKSKSLSMMRQRRHRGYVECRA